jgi:hypothetical protein
LTQLTQTPFALSRHSHWAERHRRPAEWHRRTEGHRMLQARRRRPWRHGLLTISDRGWSGHLTPGRTTGTTSGLALELLGRRGTDTFRCSSTFTMILYKLIAFTCSLWYSLVIMLILTNLLFLKILKVF